MNCSCELTSDSRLLFKWANEPESLLSDTVAVVHSRNMGITMFVVLGMVPRNTRDHNLQGKLEQFQILD